MIVLKATTKLLFSCSREECDIWLSHNVSTCYYWWCRKLANLMNLTTIVYRVAIVYEIKTTFGTWIRNIMLRVSHDGAFPGGDESCRLNDLKGYSLKSRCLSRVNHYLHFEWSNVNWDRYMHCTKRAPFVAFCAARTRYDERFTNKSVARSHGTSVAPRFMPPPVPVLSGCSSLK